MFCSNSIHRYESCFSSRTLYTNASNISDLKKNMRTMFFKAFSCIIYRSFYFSYTFEEILIELVKRPSFAIHLPSISLSSFVHSVDQTPGPNVVGPMTNLLPSTVASMVESYILCIVIA